MDAKETGANSVLWEDRKRIWCGLPWTFTKYRLESDRLFIKKGIFTVTDDEVRLYRIKDIHLTRTLSQRIFGIGTISVISSDASMGNFELINIKRPEEVRTILSNEVEEERQRKRVGVREFYGGSSGEGDADDDLENV